jgi:cytochrome d ubiquinol oxidase subunit I
MVGTTLAMYLTLYLMLATAYVSVLFHLARKAGQSAARPQAAAGAAAAAV